LGAMVMAISALRFRKQLGYLVYGKTGHKIQINLLY
jgi:hypothetical protein